MANHCSPLKAAWDLNPTYHYTCFNTEYFFLFSGIINTVTDFLCTILPAAIVLKVEMPVRKRIAVASIFFIGIFVNIASVLRIYYFAIAHISGDYWNAYPAAVAGNFEVGLGAVSSSPPFLPFPCSTAPGSDLLTRYASTSRPYALLSGVLSTGTILVMQQLMLAARSTPVARRSSRSVGSAQPAMARRRSCRSSRKTRGLTPTGHSALSMSRSSSTLPGRQQSLLRPPTMSMPPTTGYICAIGRRIRKRVWSSMMRWGNR